MIRLLLYSWLFSSRSPAGASQQQSVLSRMLQFLKKKYRELKMKFRTLKILRARRIARRRKTITDRAVQALIIGLALVLFLLVGCENGARHSLELTEPTDHTTGDDGGKLKYKIIWGSTKHND
jgi:hypothetical protein